MATSLLLLGRTPFVLGEVEEQLDLSGVSLFSGTSLEDVQRAMAADKIDVVIMGAGIAIEDRLRIIEHVFTASTSTTVHMKDWDSGPSGMLPFVNGILNALATER